MNLVRVSNNVLAVKNGQTCFVVVRNAMKQYVCLELQKVFDADFKESDHPRDKGGKFTSKGSGESGASEKGQTKEKTEIVEGYEKQVSSQRFHNKIKEAKESVPEQSRWRVDVHEAQDYEKNQRFVSEGGSTVSVTPDGDIISLCRKEGDKTRGHDLLKKAVENGGRKLDAFRGLFHFYASNGFEPVSWCEFDENYAPEGWDKNRDEKEPVIFWKYTGKKYDKTWDEFSLSVKASKDYEEAMNIRDSKMEKKNG